MSANATTPWWITQRDALLAIAEQQQNAFVYHRASVVEAVDRLRRLRSIRRVLFAMKSNFNDELLRTLAAEGVDFECVSPPEIEHLLACIPELKKSRILFTPNFAPRADYAWARKFGVRITLDNLYPLQAWPELFKDQTIFVRIDTTIGGGHHDHVVTAGQHSKFGIPLFEIDELAVLAERAGATIVGVHSHSGSGIPNPETWGAVADVLAKVADRFPEADVLDLGGGLSVPSRAGDEAFDLSAMDRALSDVRARQPDYELWIEPGRYLVAQAGVLLTHVTQLKGKGELRYVGVSTGMNALIRPSLYDAYHDIVNLTRVDEPATETATVVGPICETGDTLGRDRLLPTCRENDVILLANAGAYGRVMSSQYNLRPVPPEIVI
ncbi:MAG: hypothetical protein AAF417_09660 [Pseudomonadota bacterium]